MTGTAPPQPGVQPAGQRSRGRLVRRLGTTDAVVIGLGSMLGAGVFAAVGPAAAAAGWGLLLGLVIAALVAFCNATSSAQLAALHPEAGGAYVYGRIRLGALWGYLAGCAFVIGKTASCAALALAFGAYVAPGHQRPLALVAVAALTAVNLRGIGRTAALTRVVVGLVLATLAAVVIASLGGGQAAVHNLGAGKGPSLRGVLQAGGLLFFAFAGYARIATLAEEVRRPEVTIPRAIPIALALALAVYLVVMAAALAAVGPTVLARSATPLRAAVDAGSLSGLAPAVSVGAAIASLGVLLSLLAGVSRTTLAMARRRDLPAGLAVVDRSHGVPRLAELLVAAVVAAVACAGDLRDAVGLSAFTVLAYYAVANASALTLSARERIWPRPLAAAGLAGCALLAFALPAGSIATGAAALALGALARALAGRRHEPPSEPTTIEGRQP